MPDPHSHRIAGKSAISPDRLALLHTLVFTALRLCAAQLDAFTSRLEQAIGARAAEPASAAESGLLVKARQHLQAHRGTFQRLAADCMQRELMQAVQDVADQAASTGNQGPMDLSLITFDAMERRVILDNLSQSIDRDGAEELDVLSLRIAHWLEVDEPVSAYNPFRSTVFLKAVSNAWHTFDPDEETHRFVLREMAPPVFLDLLPVWVALNQELALRRVLPDAALVHRNRPALPVLVPPAPTDEALRQWLAPDGILNVIDARAAEMAAEVLAFLSTTELVPARARRLLPVLNAPLKKAILDDTCFFFDTHGQVRRMLESFLVASLDCRTDDGEDTLLREVEVRCARIPSAALADYLSIAEEFDSLAANAAKIDDARLRDSISAAINQENLSQAERRAEQDICARIDGGEAEPFIESFLQLHWMRVLVFAYGVHDAKPEVLQKVLSTMDELLWSLRPRQTAEERKELVDRLPGMLSMLNAWLNVVKWEGSERDAFFNALATSHATAMRGTETGSRRALEHRMDALQRASEHELDRRAQEQRVETFAPFMQEIDFLDPGAWFEFVRNDGSKVNCKLLWVSPGRSRFIFTGRQGQLLFTIDREGLAQGMHAGRVARIPAGEMVGAAISAALQKLHVK